MGTQVHEFFIRTTADKLWKAMTDGELTQQYFFGSYVSSEWKAGSAFLYSGGKGGPAMVEGKVLEIDPRHRLVNTWVIKYDPTLADEESRVTYVIEPRGENVKLTLTHDFTRAPRTEKSLEKDGWGVVLSSLKSLLETGKALDLPQQ